MKFDISMENDIKDILGENGFQFFENDNAFWRAKNNNATVIFYKKGSLLIQGNEKEKNKILNLLINLNKALTVDSGLSILGMDESGKGDYFGPLILAGCIVEDKNRAKLLKLGITDSKNLSDDKIKILYPYIINNTICKVNRLIPEKYNALYKLHKNLNKLMVEQYITLIKEFNTLKYDKLILDKFSQSYKQNAMIRGFVQKEVLIEEKAENHLAVAAASIVARHHFIEWIEKASKRYDIAFLKGCGSHAADLFCRLRDTLPKEKFERIAKTHFKAGN